MFRPQDETTNAGNPYRQLHDVWSMLGRFSGSMEPAARSWVRTNYEMQSLVGKRASAYMEFPQMLTKCRTPFDILSMQISFWQKAGGQYRESGERIMDIWQASSQESVSMASEMVTPRDFISFPDSKDEPAEGRSRRAAA
ncbi:MAG: hypothetical protein ACK5JT_09485 [Hyphomicrobiaceae bacterium]